MVAALCDAGATVHAVEIPDLDLVRTAHLTLIASEMYASQRAIFSTRGHEYGLDVQLNLALAGAIPGSTYVHAMRHRHRLTRLVREIYGQVDAIVTPSTGCAAPPIPESTLPMGESDLPLLDKIMRFAALANVTGFPAISFPVGYTDEGLPVGLQVMGRPWEEALLLRIAHVAEGLVERRRPRVWNPLLNSSAT
jgi:Asp-tRNA(Asn)/Glu-tRNA(Gln) amidotransferase A subunit family amidase